MQDIRILWLDDDSPAKNNDFINNLSNVVAGVKLFPAKTCWESEELLKTMPAPPQWAIIDLIVPQGKWGDKYYRVPGIEYIRRLKNEYKDNIKIFAFCRMVTYEIEAMVRDAGAIDAFVKSHISFVGVLEKIKACSK